jgi:hypothetical protein
VDAAEAMLVGLDSVVIAGTAAGKTMPFMMPLLLDSKNKAIIISPLKILQADQVCNSYVLFLLLIPPNFQAERFHRMRLLKRILPLFGLHILCK